MAKMKTLPLLLGKRAEMSSQHDKDNSEHFRAEKAVDGVYVPVDGLDEQASLAHSEEETQPWWRVDLAAQYCVWAVNIVDRAG